MRFIRRTRLLFSAMLLTGVVLIGAGVLVAFSASGLAQGQLPPSNVVLAAQIENSADECVVCHTNHTPGIVNQYGASDHFASNVSCSDCHLVDEGYPGSTLHPDGDFFVLRESSTAKCSTCHLEQVQQFTLSRHALPSYVAYAGTVNLSEEHIAIFQSIPEGGYDPTGKMKLRNVIHQLEGEAFTPFSCESCHDVGRPNPDGSIGDCTACHIRHEFSLEQARKPETCNNCHIGPDHPQWEIYTESSHGIAYMTGGDDWNWEAEPGTLTTADFPAPTCATCHFSGFGLSGTTHDVGDRLGWFLAAPLTTQRPNFAENRLRMQNVCRACHSDSYVQDFYVAADEAIMTVNDLVTLSDWMMKPLFDNGLVTADPFDEPIDFVYYELWHHYGRTAKSGIWMQGADYAQWHGIYEIFADLAELREMIDTRLVEAGLPPLDLPEGFPGIDAARVYIAQKAAEQEAQSEGQ